MSSVRDRFGRFFGRSSDDSVRVIRVSNSEDARNYLPRGQSNSLATSSHLQAPSLSPRRLHKAASTTFQVLSDSFRSSAQASQIEYGSPRLGQRPSLWSSIRSRGALRSSRDQDTPTSSSITPTTEKITPIGPVPILDLRLPSPSLMEPQDKGEVETPPSSLASEPHHKLESTNATNEGAIVFSRKMWPSPHIQLKEMLLPFETTSIDRSKFLDGRNQDFKGTFWPTSKSFRTSKSPTRDADPNRHHQLEVGAQRGQSESTRPETLSRRQSTTSQSNVSDTETLFESSNTVLQPGIKDLQTEAYDADTESMLSPEPANMGSHEDWVKTRTDRNNRYLAIQALGQDSDISTDDDSSFGVTLQQIPTKKYRTRSKRNILEHWNRSIHHKWDVKRKGEDQADISTDERLEDSLPLRKLQHESGVGFMSYWYGQEKCFKTATEDSKCRLPVTHHLKDPFDTTLRAAACATHAPSSQQPRFVSAQSDSTIENYAVETTNPLRWYTPPYPFQYLQSGPISASVPVCLGGMDLLDEFDTSGKIASLLKPSSEARNWDKSLILYGTCPSPNSSKGPDEGHLLKCNMRRATSGCRSHAAEEDSSEENASTGYPDLFRSSDGAAEKRLPRLADVSMVERRRKLNRTSAARELCEFVYQCEKEDQEESEKSNECLSECPTPEPFP